MKVHIIMKVHINMQFGCPQEPRVVIVYPTHFKTTKFFQGIFSICDRFNIDYRDCIYGIPFDQFGKKYTFDGYNLLIYQVAQDAPDLSDVEEEEKDDENIIDPFSVSDGDDENQFD